MLTYFLHLISYSKIVFLALLLYFQLTVIVWYMDTAETFRVKKQQLHFPEKQHEPAEQRGIYSAYNGTSVLATLAAKELNKYFKSKCVHETWESRIFVVSVEDAGNFHEHFIVEYIHLMLIALVRKLCFCFCFGQFVNGNLSAALEIGWVSAQGSQRLVTQQSVCFAFRAGFEPVVPPWEEVSLLQRLDTPNQVGWNTHRSCRSLHAVPVPAWVLSGAQASSLKTCQLVLEVWLRLVVCLCVRLPPGWHESYPWCPRRMNANPFYDPDTENKTTQDQNSFPSNTCTLTSYSYTRPAFVTYSFLF